MLFAELGAVAEEFAAGFGGGGLFELLEEERSECGGRELRFGEELVDLVLAFGVESAGLEGGDLFAEVIALETGGEELLFETGDLGGDVGSPNTPPSPLSQGERGEGGKALSRGKRGGRGLAFAEGHSGGGVHHGVDADDIADRLDGAAIGGALGEDDVGHADAGEIGVRQGEEGAARFGVEDADVASDATVLEAGIDNVADEVAGAAVAGLEPVGSVVEEDRLLVVERDSFSKSCLRIVIAVFGVWSRQSDVEDQSGGGVDGERVAPVGEVFSERVVRHRSWPVRGGKGSV